MSVTVTRLDGSPSADADAGRGLSAPAARRAALTLARGVANTVFVLWGAVTVTFAALSLVKGSTIDAIAGTTPLSPAVRAQIITDYHLDRSPVEQYLNYLWRLMHGDLGQSYALRLPVAEAIGQQIGSTFALLAAASVLAVVAAVVTAVATANRARWLRAPAGGLEVVLVAIPAFWLGILLLSVFSFSLHWFPAVGSDGVSSLVLPAVALAAAPAALMAQVLRRGLERTLEEPFVVTVRTRGVSEAALLLRHVLRHALMPIVTLLGWLAGSMIGGAIVIEQVFSRQGLGRLIVTAIGSKDFPLITGIVLIAAAFYAVVNLLIDATYALVDPRLRTGLA